MKKYIIIRADDLGYSEAINYGIYKTVKDGIIRTLGLMVNMDSTEHGLNIIKEYDCCIGLHTNISVGRPVLEAHKIPSLVDENGFFKSSKVYRTAQDDFVKYDEVYKEIEAQYLRFKELLGKDPDYFEAHAIKSDNFFKALEKFALEHNLKYIPMQSKSIINGKYVNMCELNSIKKDYDAEKSLKDELLKLDKDSYSTYVCHPGYLDSYVCNTSSLLEGRMKEVDLLCRGDIKKWLDENNFEIITYRNL